MRNQWLLGRVIALLLCLTLSVVACVQPLAIASPSLQANQRLAKLVGSWQVETTVVQQAVTFPALLTFTSDGIVIADEPPSPFETSGHGNWIATGPDTANFTFLALIGSADGPLSATIKVVGSLHYKASTDTWAGPFMIQVVDAKGDEILADRGTFNATRIAVEPLSDESTAVFDAFNAAVNAHDVDKALSFFADDATAQFPNQPQPNQFTGSAEIRIWLENDAQDNIHVEIEDVQTSGDRVSATAKVDVDSLPPDLILVGTVEVMVKGGKIMSFAYTFNEDTLAKLQALQPR